MSGALAARTPCALHRRSSLVQPGWLAPILALQTFLDRPNVVSTSMAMCVSLSHHGVAVQRGVTISTVIPVSSILVSVFDISGGGGKAMNSPTSRLLRKRTI